MATTIRAHTPANNERAFLIPSTFPNGIFGYSINVCVITCNKKFLRVLHHSHPTVCNRTKPQHPSDAKAVVEPPPQPGTPPPQPPVRHHDRWILKRIFR